MLKLLLLTLFLQPTIQEELDFIKAKNANQNQRFDKAWEEKKDVCYVIGDALTLEEYLKNKEKYVFIFFPKPTKEIRTYFKDIANFAYDKGVILAKHYPHKKGYDIISTHQSFPKASAPLSVGTINLKPQYYYVNGRLTCNGALV